MGMCDSKANMLLLIINTITIIVGVLVLITGVMGLLNQGALNDYTGGQNTELICYGILVTGVIILVVGLIGWYAGFTSNLAIAKAYVFLIILITVLQLIFCIVEFLQRTSISSEVDSYMNETFNGTVYADLPPMQRDVVDLIQGNLECCGLESPADWEGALPESCCSNSTTNSTIPFECNVDSAFDAGCRAEAQAFAESVIMMAVIILAIGFFLEFVCIFAGIWVTKHVSEYKRV